MSTVYALFTYPLRTRGLALFKLGSFSVWEQSTLHYAL